MQIFIYSDKRLPVHQDQKVHISPQEGRAQLAVGLPVTFEIDYLEDADKQLDLYYILDLSHTMKDDKVFEHSQKRQEPSTNCSLFVTRL